MTATVRDYGLTGADSRRAVDLGLLEAEWFRPPIDPDRLRVLQVRTNARAARDTALWLGLLAVFGYLAFRSLGSWWAVPAFMAYGALYGGAGDSRWHECGHGTAFRTKWLNDVVYYIASFMLLRQPTLWRWSHVRHHTDTIVVGRDPEIVFPRPSSLRAVLGVFVPVLNVPKAMWRTLKHAAGRIDDDARNFIPGDELGKLKWESRAYISVLAGTAVWCVAIGSIVPALYIGLPTVYGAWLMVFFAVTQHAGLREDVLDHRLNSRTVYMNPFLRFLYSNMNYHVEHHIFPTVPYYALPALHAEIKECLAPPDPSTLTAYRRILSTLRRQWSDPSYDEPRPDVPEAAGAERSFVDTGVVVWAGESHDGLLDLGPAEGLGAGSARRIDRGDATYALYRLGTDDGADEPAREFVLSDGLCTHGRAHLAEGAVLDGMIECPKHNGCFDLRTGEALRFPATEPITLYDVAVRNGRLVSRLAPRQPGGTAVSAPAAMQVYGVDGVVAAVRGGTAVSAPAAMQVYGVDGVVAAVRGGTAVSAPAAMQVYGADGVVAAVRGGTAVSAPAAMQVYGVDGVVAAVRGGTAVSAPAAMQAGRSATIRAMGGGAVSAPSGRAGCGELDRGARRGE